MKMKLLRKYTICFVALAGFFLAAALGGFQTAHAATTGTPWSAAKSDYPASTAGTVNMNAGGIVWSRHNLSSLSNWFQPYTTKDCVTLLPGDPPLCNYRIVTTQVCVFCHTPHHANPDGGGPLWNRSNTATDYVAYGTTIAGTDVSNFSNATGGASLACLSCHDGITTFDTIINAPGKGSQTDAIGVDRTWQWGMWGNDFETDRRNDHFRRDAGTCDRCHPQSESDRLNIGLGPGSTISYDGFGRPNGGTASLQNDHPVNVVYATDGRASLRSPGTIISSIVMDQPNASSFGRSDNLWSVNGRITDSASISDLLRDGGKVQCGSCHDPHYKNQTNDDPGVVSSYSRPPGTGTYNTKPGVQNITDPQHELIDGLFLRRVGGNSNSGVCRTCHAK
ncbi:MAG: hypothetical protein ACE5D4_03140 [Thermodesulfobacteriota bacterium]